MVSVLPLIMTWEDKTILFLFFLVIVCHLLSSTYLFVVYTELVHQPRAVEYGTTAQHGKCLSSSNLI